MEINERWWDMFYNDVSGPFAIWYTVYIYIYIYICIYTYTYASMYVIHIEWRHVMVERWFASKRDNIKTPHHCFVVRGIHWWQVVPRTNASNAGSACLSWRHPCIIYVLLLCNNMYNTTLHIIIIFIIRGHVNSIKDKHKLSHKAPEDLSQ